MILTGTYEANVTFAGFTRSKRSFMIDAGMRLRVLGEENEGFVTVELFSENTLGTRVLSVRESDLRLCTRIKIR
jgi:hypothetical protein